MRILLVIFLITSAPFSSWSQEEAIDSSSQLQNTDHAKEESHKNVLQVAEQMPRFPECEHLDTNEEKHRCAQTALLKYIYSRINYPQDARIEGVEGTAVIQFLVKEDGTITNVKSVREIWPSIEEEAARVVGLMAKEAIVWTPGVRKGQNVSVKFTLPVSFKLENPRPTKRL